MPQLHMPESENKTHGIVGRPSDGRVGLEWWNDGKRQAENGIKYQKSRSLAAIFFNQICFEADVTGNSNFRGKGVSKNKTISENAVAQI